MAVPVVPVRRDTVKKADWFSASVGIPAGTSSILPFGEVMDEHIVSAKRNSEYRRVCQLSFSCAFQHVATSLCLYSSLSVVKTRCIERPDAQVVLSVAFGIDLVDSSMRARDNVSKDRNRTSTGAYTPFTDMLPRYSYRLSWTMLFISLRVWMANWNDAHRWPLHWLAANKYSRSLFAHSPRFLHSELRWSTVNPRSLSFRSAPTSLHLGS